MKSLQVKIQRLIESDNHSAIRVTDEAFEKIINFLVESKEQPQKGGSGPDPDAQD